MQISDLEALLKEYNDNRGWFRFFFGNTRGIKNLNQLKNEFKNNLDVTKLSDEQCAQIEELLAQRAHRLIGRDDNYYLAAGRKKLTNKIYQQLAHMLSSHYQAQGKIGSECYLMPYLANGRDSQDHLLDTLSLDQIEVFEDQQQFYGINPSAYAATMTIENAWQNPVTQEPLPPSVQEKLLTHTQLGHFFAQCVDWLRQLTTKLWSGHELDNSWCLKDIKQTEDGVFYHKPTAREGYLKTLTNLSYQDYIKNQSVYDELSPLEQDPKALNQVYLTVITNIIALDKFEYQQLSTLNDQPIYSLYIDSRLKIIFSLEDFIVRFEEKDPGKILNPTTGEDIPFEQFIKVYNAINQRTQLPVASKNFIKQVTELGLVKDKQAYKHYLHLQKLKNNKTIAGDRYLYQIKKSDLFVTEDGYGFELRELLQTLTLGSGFLNPITREPFSEQDLESLLSRTDYGRAVTVFNKILLAKDTHYWGEDDYQKDWRILDMGISELGRVFNKESALKILSDSIPSLTCEELQKDLDIFQSLIKLNKFDPETSDNLNHLIGKLSAINLMDSSISEKLSSAKLAEIYLSQSHKQAFKLQDFVNHFIATKTIVNPETKEQLSHEDFLDLYLSLELMDEQCVDFESLRALVDNCMMIEDEENYNNYCLTQFLKNKTTLDGLTPLYSLSSDRLFITEDGYGFDVFALLKTFTFQNGIVNPITGITLSENDIEKLSNQKLIGEQFEYCQSLLALDETLFKEQFENVPLVNLLQTKSGLVDLSSMRPLFFENRDKLLNPINSGFFHYEEYQILSWLFGDKQSKQDFSLGEYQNYLMDVNQIPEQDHEDTFISESDHVYSVVELFASFTTAGFYYPESSEPLTEQDITTLNQHPKYQQAFKRLTASLARWQKFAEEQQHSEHVSLQYIYCKEDGRCIDVSKESLSELVQAYNDDKISETELREIIEQMESCQCALDYSSIEAKVFWQLVHKEIYTRLSQFEKTAVCVYMGIKAFEENPEPLVKKVWDENDVIYKTLGHGEVKIYRTDSLHGDKIYPAIKQMIADYKIAFMKSFQLNKVTEFFQQTDKTQLCLLENVKQCLTWASSFTGSEPDSPSLPKVTFPNSPTLFSDSPEAIPDIKGDRPSLKLVI